MASHHQGSQLSPALVFALPGKEAAQQDADNGNEQGDRPKTQRDDSEVVNGCAFCSLEGHDEGVLERLQPRYVVMYDPDIAFVRQLEVITSCVVPVWQCKQTYLVGLQMLPPEHK